MSDAADKEFDLVFSTIKIGRSLAASYNLQTDIQRPPYFSHVFVFPYAECFAFFALVFLHIQTEEVAQVFESQLPTIVALTKGCKSAKIVRDLKDIPAGCGAAVVNPTLAVHTLVRVSWRSPPPISELL